MASATSPLVSRNASYSSLCHAGTKGEQSHKLLQHPLLSALKKEQDTLANSMRRSSSAPCLAKATTRFVTTSTRDGGFEEHQTSLLGNSRSEMQERQMQVLHDQQTEASARKSRAAPAMAQESRFASLSRVLLVSQPSNMFRSLANRKWPSAVGPISLLVFLFGTLLAILAAVRSALVRKVKACKCCKGFGVVRCRLCDGTGSVDWRAKFSYSEQCPLCMAKRFVVCPDCGGHYHRRLFSHAKAAGTEGSTGLAGAGAGAFGSVGMPAARD